MSENNAAEAVRVMPNSPSEDHLIRNEHPIAPAPLPPNVHANPEANIPNAAELPQPAITTSASNELATPPNASPAPAPAQRPVKTHTEAEILRNFVVNPAPSGRKVFCHVIRRRTPLNPYCNYELYLEQPEQPPKFIMNAKKTPKSRTALYRMSLKKNDYSTPSAIIGKVRSNFLGTTFTVHDNGRNPFKETTADAGPDDRPIRRELACAIYEANVMGFKGPRKMTITLPQMTPDAKFQVYAPTQEQDTLAEKFKTNPESLLVLYNKSPQWNEETQSFVLNFGGRVTLASVKNFQITHPDDLDYVVLQFGRVSEDKFTMDFQFPLTCIQAFGIALSSFDGKIACE